MTKEAFEEGGIAKLKLKVIQGGLEEVVADCVSFFLFFSLLMIVGVRKVILGLESLIAASF